ncbi:4-(cytidine 5'-diphospho)-2-C-methyl-D-erythritol kinase [Hyphomonas sp.]|uniref:4-(cytidine 5'-diphospho)-2-C-methyl-D-erythritol kinase n=1 Tax=Hyphomonas sp. TaxID=87 RepID=UPI00333F6EA0
MTRLTATAAAKVNLFLHVGPVKANGRHDLDSLVVFSGPEVGDGVTAELADGLSLEVTGPYASASGETGDNLMLKAARALQAATSSQMGARLTLDKRLPVAAGIGGGSSDAAAVLRLLTLLWAIDPAHAAAAAPGLGGDVPVALEGLPALMRGEGEQVVPVSVKPLPAVLVNPGALCPTGPVFRAYDASGGGGDFALIGDMPQLPDAAGLSRWLTLQRNDLEAPAIALVPAIGAALSALRAQPGVQLARMSGSGATCFALCESAGSARALAAALKAQHPDWWVEACSLGAAPWP